MSWVGISDSGIAFSTAQGEWVAFDNSRFTGHSGSWGISRDDGAPFRARVTAISYTSFGASSPGAIDAEGSDSVINQGGSTWAPSPMEFQGATAIRYEPGTEESSAYQFLVEVWVGGGVVEPRPPMGLATRNIVSAYQRDRVFRSSLFANESRRLVTDFNGVIPKGQAIQKAVWQTNDLASALMAEPAIDGTAVSVRVSAQWSGRTRIRVDVTLDNGDIYSAWQIVRVMAAPYFNNPGWATGPRRLEVSTP